LPNIDICSPVCRVALNAANYEFRLVPLERDVVAPGLVAV